MSGARRGAAAWARLRYLFNDADPAPVELLTAAISLWFAMVLALGSSRNGPSPAWVWALVALAAASLKLVGTLGEYRIARFAGSLAGCFFWLVLAGTLFVTVDVSLTWGGFIVIGLGNAWAVWRVMRP